MAAMLKERLPGSGFEAPPLIALRLQDAAAVYADTATAERMLGAALAADPTCLASYFALYKFYFYKRRLEDAERIAVQALDVAAQQSGINGDWSMLSHESADWSRVDAPQHFYLFTLKALAFMRLRLGRGDEARVILAKLQELDPRDSVGADVIRAMSQ